MKEIKMKIECPYCEGTGVYVGMGERDGAAVVCIRCEGTGSYEYKYQYNEFAGRKKRKDVTRVFLSGYGYCVGVTEVILDNGVRVDFSKEGITYEEFLGGKMPKHIKHLGCPMSADQSACHDIKGFTDVCNNLNGGWLSHIPSCRCDDKAKCWERFERRG